MKTSLTSAVLLTLTLFGTAACHHDISRRPDDKVEGSGAQDFGPMSLKDSARVYSDYVTTGNAGRAYELLSMRCRRQLPFARFERIVQSTATSRRNPLPLKEITERVDGRHAAVTYTYSDSRSPSRSDRWVKEHELWKEDSC